MEKSSTSPTRFLCKSASSGTVFPNCSPSSTPAAERPDAARPDRASPPERDGDADHRAAKQHHRDGGRPGREAAAAAVDIAAKEQHGRGDRVGNAQSQTRVADEEERQRNRKRRQEAKQAQPYGGENIVLFQRRPPRQIRRL